MHVPIPRWKSTAVYCGNPRFDLPEYKEESGRPLQSPVAGLLPESICAEVEKLRIELRKGRVLEFRQLAGGACDSPCDSRSECNEKPPRKFASGLSISESRGLDLNPLVE